MCKELMPVSVKVYLGREDKREIRRFTFRPDDPKGQEGIFRNLLDRIRALYNGLNLQELNLCWKDDDGDYVVFSSDDELRVAMNSVTDNTLRLFIREKELKHSKLVHPPSCGTSPSAPVTPSNRRRVELFRSPCHTPLLPHSSKVDGVSNHTEPLTDACNDQYAVPVLNSGSGPPSRSCSECGGAGRGVWYKCTVCSTFYLCSACEIKGLHDQHIMVRISTGYSPLQI